jgi:hypothetical protein
MTFQIEKGIPIPASARRKANSLYPFDDLRDVEDSFLVPCPAEDTKAARARISSAVGQFHKRHKESGVRLAVRPVPGGVRVWRTA